VPVSILYFCSCSSVGRRPSGDRLDALFCAIQTAWAWTMRSERYGVPEHLDPLEGWIADPSLREIQEPAGPASA
jgi:hypothetical protein